MSLWRDVVRATNSKFSVDVTTIGRPKVIESDVI
jgi:hypothetical protein